MKRPDRQSENLRDKSTKHPEAFAALQDFQRTLQAHTTLLDARVKALGGSATQPVKDAVSAIAGFVAGLANAVREEEASKSLRDDYTYFSHVAIGYLMPQGLDRGDLHALTRAIAMLLAHQGTTRAPPPYARA